jgi:hypothetical protein
VSTSTPDQPEHNTPVTKEFDNNWQAIFDTPEHRFARVQAGDVITRAGSWDLPSEYAVIVRVQDPKNYKVTEKSFKRVSAATRFVNNKEADGYLVTAYNERELYSSVGFEPDDEDD